VSGYSFQTGRSSPDVEYVVGGELPALKLWWVDDQDALIDFSQGWDFTATISKGSIVYVSKDIGIVGAVGSGVPLDGTPNLTINWSNNEFAAIANPGVYVLSIEASADNNAGDLIQLFDFFYTQPGSASWTYTSDPANSNRDAVRFLVGDVDPYDQLASDQEVDWLLSDNTVYESASKLCLAIAGRFARCIDKSIGSLSKSYSQKYQHYLELSSTIAAKESSSLMAGPWASGWSHSAKQAVELNDDRESTFAKKGDMDNPDEGSYYGR